MKRLQLAVTILWLAGVAVAVQAQDTVSITYKPMKPGEVVRTRMGTDMVGTMSGMGPGSQNMTQKNDQWMKMECLGADPAGVTTVRMTFERMAMTMNIGPMTVAFDSADKDRSATQMAFNPAARMFEAMVGKSVTMRFDPQGKCLGVTGLREMMDDVFKQVPGGEQMAKLMESMLSDDAIMERFGYIGWLPKKPVAVGDTWTTQQDMSAGPMGKVVMKGKNKLIGIETVNGRRCARVATTTNMEMGNEDKPYEVKGMHVQMHMTSTGGTGSWLWDIDRGQMVLMKTTAPVEITTEAQPQASQTQPTNNFKMVQKMTYTTTVELVEGDPNRIPLKTETTRPVGEPSVAGQMTPPPTPASQPADNKP